MRTSQITWLPSGIGYLPVTDNPYDDAYFEKYQAYADTDMGIALTKARVALVEPYMHGGIVDVGIGSGQFVLACRGARGFDINPAAVKWLHARGLFRDPRREPVDAACFWDSLEHIANPAEILGNVRHFVFVSLPIFNNLVHVLRSKHYRPDEHCWYFTDSGFVTFMEQHGWSLVHHDRRESELGREDIHSYAFHRTQL